MKYLNTLVAVAALAFIVSGCGGLNRIAYRTTGTAAISADHAMNAWGAYVRAGRATEADEAKVRSAYDTYQEAALVVTDAALAYHAVPNDQTQLALNRALAASGAALGHLVGLVAQFIPEITQP